MSISLISLTGSSVSTSLTGQSGFSAKLENDCFSVVLQLESNLILRNCFIIRLRPHYVLFTESSLIISDRPHYAYLRDSSLHNQGGRLSKQSREGVCSRFFRNVGGRVDDCDS